MGKSNNTGKIIGAILLGAAIGGVLGILFAPNKGIVTRKKITGKSDGLTDDLEDKFNDFLEEVKKEVETVKEKTNELMKNGTSKVEKFKVN